MARQCHNSAMLDLDGREGGESDGDEFVPLSLAGEVTSVPVVLQNDDISHIYLAAP